MGSCKQGSSETSSEENERQEQVSEGASNSNSTTSSSSKRSYECTFCKRGFTNAQALGGHMNIHRKDRTKTKQVSSGSSISETRNEEYMKRNHMGPISSEHTNYYPVLEAQRNYPMYFHSSGSSSPRKPHSFYHGSDLLVLRHQYTLSINIQELWGANLSLQMGSNNHLEENQQNREVPKIEEVDLELRLGHDR